jgi:CRP-like cAMP-binding protein
LSNLETANLSARTSCEEKNMAAALNVASRTQPVAPPDALRAIGSIVHFSRNETIFNEGDEAAFSYQVISGSVRLSKVMLDGRRQISDFALAGDLVGLDWGRDYALTAEAIGEVTAVRYNRARLERLGEEKIDVRRRVTDVLRRDLWAAQNHLLMLGRQTAKERLASFLMLFVTRSGAQNGEAFDLPMGRQDIADYLGLTIETVCRTLAELKVEKLISIPSRHELIVHDAGSLRAIAHGESN